MKLPKVSVPTFDGKVLNWKNFWEQFDVTIHGKTALSDTAKLMYLQDALKDGPARFVIQGLTRTSESYEEAIKCLKERYDRPRLVEEGTHPQYRGCCSSEERKREGASPSL